MKFTRTRATIDHIEEKGGQTLDELFNVFGDICADIGSKENGIGPLQELPIGKCAALQEKLCSHINLLLLIGENYEELFEEEAYKDILPDFFSDLKEMEKKLKSPAKKELDFEEQLITYESLANMCLSQMEKLQNQLKEYNETRFDIVLKLLREE